MSDPDHMTLNQASKLLGVSRSLLVRAVAQGRIRATSTPFKSNLNPQGSSNLVLVEAEDIRKCAKGEINLEVLKGAKVAERAPTPKTDLETREMLTDIKQTGEQCALMCSAILERLDAASPTLTPKPPKGTKSYEPHA